MDNKKITIFSHLLAWIVLFSMPYVLSYGQEQEINRVIAHFWIPIGFYVIIFYSNYFVLIDRFLFTQKTTQFIVSNLAMIVLFLILKEQIENTFFQEIAKNRPRSNDGSPPIKLSIYIHLLSFMAPLFFSIAIKTTKRWAKTEDERKEAANYKLKSELQHLHYQLQPHFFFNALNNIYSLVDVSPEQAKKSIHSLSKLMRYMLYETNMELVPLSKEVSFMEKYIELMKLRVSDKTRVQYQFPSEETGIEIAPLLFISLIENAFKHGVSASKESLIDVTLTCEQKKVVFTIVNDDFPKQTDDKSGSGIGLQNLEKRLQLLYAGKFKFTTETRDGRFSVHLEIDTM
ncbi:MAG: histidine kinase [Cyclobacteriaceae bacterium]